MEFGDKVLAVLRRNPTIDEIMKECDLNQKDAYNVQWLYTTLWQVLSKKGK